MDLSLRSIKTNNWPADNSKKGHLNELYTWMFIRMSTIKLKTDRFYTCTLWTPTWPVMPSPYKKTANQSARTIVFT